MLKWKLLVFSNYKEVDSYRIQPHNKVALVLGGFVWVTRPKTSSLWMKGLLISRRLKPTRVSYVCHQIENNTEEAYPT